MHILQLVKIHLSLAFQSPLMSVIWNLLLIKNMTNMQYGGTATAYSQRIHLQLANALLFIALLITGCLNSPIITESSTSNSSGSNDAISSGVGEGYHNSENCFWFFLIQEIKFLRAKCKSGTQTSGPRTPLKFQKWDPRPA